VERDEGTQDFLILFCGVEADVGVDGSSPAWCTEGFADGDCEALGVGCYGDKPGGHEDALPSNSSY